MPDVAALAMAQGAAVRGIAGPSTQLLREVARFVERKGLRLPVEREFDSSEEVIISARSVFGLLSRSRVMFDLTWRTQE